MQQELKKHNLTPSSNAKIEKSKIKVLAYCEQKKIRCVNLDNYISGNYTVLEFECIAKNHKWTAKWRDQQKSKAGCGQCHCFWSIEDAQEIAIARGGICLSTSYARSCDQLEWQCRKGHIFKADMCDITGPRKSWCRRCWNESQRLGIDYVKEIVEKKGGLCLSTEYEGIGIRMKFQCEFGHTWEATPSKIILGRWCHHCTLGKKQRVLTNIVKELFPNRKIGSNVRNNAWLRNELTKTNMELDIVVYNSDGSIYIAIEHDGRQHFEVVEKFGGQEGFEDCQRRDAVKSRLLEENKDKYQHFIRFNYKDIINESTVLQRLQENGIFPESVPI